MYNTYKNSKMPSQCDGKVLVTGASGFVATHIVQQLMLDGYQVRGTVRNLQNEEKVKALKSLCPDAKYPLELVEADLLEESGWKGAVTGCNYVMHTASPFTLTEPDDEEELIKPAVDGTLNVLRACAQAGVVKRVVLTSSCVAMFGSGRKESGKPFIEDDWTDPETCPKIPAYNKSKTLAEKAAWDFVKNLDASERFELSVINPSVVFGPVLCGGPPGASMQLILALMMRLMPAVVNFQAAAVDARDVARAHIIAMTSTQAAGQRLIASTQTMHMKDVAEILVKEYGPQGYDIPTNVEGPAFGVFDPFDNSRFRKALGTEPIALEKSVIDMTNSMIEIGLIKRN